jgi:hypothetical protein
VLILNRASAIATSNSPAPRPTNVGEKKIGNTCRIGSREREQKEREKERERSN